MRRFISLCALLAIAAFALCACGGSSANADTAGGEPAQTNSFSYSKPQVILDDENVTISITGFETLDFEGSDGSAGYAATCTAVNKTNDRIIDASMADLAVDGHALSSATASTAIELMPGSESSCEMDFFVDPVDQSVVSYASDLASMSGTLEVDTYDAASSTNFDSAEHYKTTFSIK